MIRRLGDKLRALLDSDALNGIEADLQALTEAEGLGDAGGAASAPGGRPARTPAPSRRLTEMCTRLATHHGAA